MMCRRLFIVTALALTAASSLAQRSTELYIPIGESPGVSETLTFTGTITSIDAEGRRLQVSGDSEEISVDVTDETRIYIDRSETGGRNTEGSLEDFANGLVVEVLSMEPENRGRGPAEWIKIRAPS